MLDKNYVRLKQYQNKNILVKTILDKNYVGKYYIGKELCLKI